MSFDAPIRGYESPGSRQEQSIPSEIGALERGEIDLPLILQDSLYTSTYQSPILELAGGWIIRRRRITLRICRRKAELAEVQGLGNRWRIGRVDQRRGLGEG